MSGQWKPGDVAIAKYRGEKPLIYLRVHSRFAESQGERWQSQEGSHSDGFELADWWRRLVVIDPEDPEQVERLVRGYCDAHGVPTDAPIRETGVDYMQAALREFANPTPPKPEEPTGLGAVVEDDTGRLFIRQHDGWWRGDEPCSLNWSAVHAVRVLSEGVTA